MNFNGRYDEKAYSTVEMIDNPFNKSARKIRAPKIYDLFSNVTVMGAMSEKPADKTAGTLRSCTISVAVASATNTRRITAFGDELADKLKNLAVGTVISAYGNSLYSLDGPNGTSLVHFEVNEEATKENMAMIEAAQKASEKEMDRVMEAHE